MGLRAKLLVVGACTTAVMLCLTYIVAREVVFRAFEDLEARQTRDHVRRAGASLAQHIELLGATALDWAAWDDTYAFADSRDDDYIASNLLPSTLENLDIQILAVLDASGEVIHIAEDATDGASHGLGSDLVLALRSSAPTPWAYVNEPLVGTVELPQGLALVASHPIVRSDSSGPSRGSLVMARLLDDAQVTQLSEITRLPIEIIAAGQLDPSCHTTQASSLPEQVCVLDTDEIAGYAPVLDAWGEPVAYLRIVLPRDVSTHGRNTVILFIVAMAASTTLAMAAAVLALQRRVVGPVADLDAFVKRVSQSGDVGARATPAGSAEVASLGHNINAMLAALGASERRREHSDERYRSLVENLRDVIYTLDPDGAITYMSPAVTAVLGLAPDEVIGQPFARFVHPDDTAGASGIVQEVLAGASREGECRLWTVEGNVRWVWFSARPQMVEGQAVGLQGLLTDVTQRRYLEEQLRQSQKMEAVGQLAEAIAHDFNNLLTVINGYAASALQTMDATDPRREDIRQIHDAGQRGATLTRQLLTFGRRHTGAPQVVALNEVLAGASDMLWRIVGNRVAITVDVPEEGLYVQAEPGQMEQVLMNLVINARDAMPDGGTLSLRACLEAPIPGDSGATDAPERCVVLSVQDSGMGMTPEVMEHAFEPFFSTKEPGKGTGLGLTTVYGIVRQNRGRVTLESAPGRGTTVTIRLPATPAPAQPKPAEAATADVPRGTERVLLVEDQAEVRRLAQRMLQHIGYQVDAADNPVEVLNRYDPSQRRYDLVLSDVAMPEMSGPDMVARLRERGNGFAVVYMSGYAEEYVASRTPLGPNARFLQKPFDVRQLAAVVRSALDAATMGARHPGMAA